VIWEIPVAWVVDIGADGDGICLVKRNSSNSAMWKK
jgi:hypothetical protein